MHMLEAAQMQAPHKHDLLLSWQGDGHGRTLHAQLRLHDA